MRFSDTAGLRPQDLQRWSAMSAAEIIVVPRC